MVRRLVTVAPLVDRVPPEQRDVDAYREDVDDDVGDLRAPQRYDVARVQRVADGDETFRRHRHGQPGARHDEYVDDGRAVAAVVRHDAALREHAVLRHERRRERH